MIRTVFSIAASAVARLIAVVVLPTPPFWFATVKTRALVLLAMFRTLRESAKPRSADPLHIGDFKNAGCRIDPARML